METTYDVFKGTPESKPLWLGTISGLRRAIQMMNTMGERLPDSYFIVEQGHKKVVAAITGHSHPATIAKAS